MMTNHEEIKAVFRQVLVFHHGEHEDQGGSDNAEDDDHDVRSV